MLRKMGNKLERLEDDIFEGERPSEIVRDISNVKQEIINFRRVVRPQRAALKDLEATKRYIPDDLEIYFDDINDASERIWDMLENYKEVVEALESTNESVLSHRLNDTFRVLTAISVIVLPLTLIASIWGMNTKVPGEGSHAGFFAVVGVMVIVLVATIMLFKRRGWLCSARPAGATPSARRGGDLGARAAEGGRRRSAMPGSGSSGEEWRCLGNDAAAGWWRCRVWRRARRVAFGGVRSGCRPGADAPMRLAGVPRVRVTRPSS